jgi:hypothetical protein
MKKLVLILFMLLLMFSQNLKGKKLGILSGVLKPDAIEVAGNRLYVVEGARFSVYGLPALNLISRFGKKGEGPGELKTVSMLPNTLRVLPDGIFIDGMDKVVFFSRDYRFKKEIKKKYMTFKTIPVGNNFVAMQMEPAGNNRYYFSVLLLDSEMNRIKELVKQSYRETDRDIDMVIDSLHFDVFKNKIYIEKSLQGFVIAVFDQQGNLETEIKKEFTVPKISSRDKKDMMENLQNDPLVKMMAEREGGWNNFRKRMNFNYPEAYPAIRNLLVSENQIVTTTYHQQNHLQKYIIMDLTGTLEKSVWLPVPHRSSYLTQAMGRDNRFYGITGNHYFYLKENADSEEWEIHMVEINPLLSQ